MPDVRFPANETGEGHGLEGLEGLEGGGGGGSETDLDFLGDGWVGE